MQHHGCDHCRELNQTFRIKSPGELEKAIRVAAANIADDTIRESGYRPPDTTNYCDAGSFASLARGETWGDFLDYYFECTKCKSLYHLGAETYHGSGGSWSPAGREKTLTRLREWIRKCCAFLSG
jgi:hypothetical protein